jgi:hypothetical protein
MINIEEDQPCRELGFIRRKDIWIREGKGANHLSSEIIPNNIQHRMSPICQRLLGKYQDSSSLNVWHVREITCIYISLIEEKG